MRKINTQQPSDPAVVVQRVVRTHRTKRTQKCEACNGYGFYRYLEGDGVWRAKDCWKCKGNGRLPVKS